MGRSFAAFTTKTKTRSQIASLKAAVASLQTERTRISDNDGRLPDGVFRIRQGDVFTIDGDWAVVLSGHNPTSVSGARVRVWTAHRHDRQFVAGGHDSGFPPSEPIGQILLPYGARDEDWHQRTEADVQKVLAAHTAGKPLRIRRPNRPSRTTKQKLARINQRLRQKQATLREQEAAANYGLDGVVSVLATLGYLRVADDGWALTGLGASLRRIHREQSLLIAETLRNGLTTSELAATASTLVYEHRSPTAAAEPAHPTRNTEQAVAAIGDIRARLVETERRHGVSRTPPDPQHRSAGFFNHAYAWAAGGSLQQSKGSTMPPGDFIRNVRDVADLLRQIADTADTPLARTARAAAAVVNRGVVTADPYQPATLRRRTLRPQTERLKDRCPIHKPDPTDRL